MSFGRLTDPRSLHEEKRLIENGILKEDNPLDNSEPFRKLCGACRRGDLKLCQQMITEGANINGKDLFDYTPLILVSRPGFEITGQFFCQFLMLRHVLTFCTRPVFADTTRSSRYSLSRAHFVRETLSKAKGAVELASDLDMC